MKVPEVLVEVSVEVISKVPGDDFLRPLLMFLVMFILRFLIRFLLILGVVPNETAVEVLILGCI